ncbi:MAG: peptidoglycan-binding protein [Clostridia bacterium]|nr:peptidoglycan-binding protein [Clostridia bacterium]
MKKVKLISFILTLVLLLGLVPSSAFAAVGTGWNDDCRGHRVQGDTPGTIVYGKHDWVKKSETPGSSCTAKGTATYRCSYCGANATRETKAPGHKWGSWKTTKEATCEKHGEETRKCRVCGKKDTRQTDRKAHTWGEWTVVTEPTDFSAGIRSRSCRVCGTERTDDLDPEGTLRRGDRGDDVKALQEGLNAAGYDCGKADGDFGKKTEAAVKAIEAAHGIDADGVAWPGVQNWLRNGGRGGPGSDAPEEEDPRLWVEADRDDDASDVLVGQTINYTVYLFNDTGEDLTDVTVTCYDGSGSERGTFDLPFVAAGDVPNFEDSYTFTKEDAALTDIALTWVPSGVRPDGTRILGEAYEFTYYVVDSEAGQKPVMDLGPLSAVKSANVTGISSGGKIVYTITVTNRSDEILYDVEVWDPLKGSNEDMCVDRWPELAPHESRSAGFTYTVTEEPGAAITNRAKVTWFAEDAEESSEVSTNAVTVKVLDLVSGRREDAEDRKVIGAGSHRHEFTRWRVIRPLTRVADGVRRRVCLRCGLEQTDIIGAAPRIKEGQRGPRVVELQHIFEDMGYRPAVIDGVAAKPFWELVDAWSRDHGWYYEPGLLRPVEIDRIVNGWIERQEGIGVSGEGTPVNIVFTLTPEREYGYVYDGEKLSFSWEAVNLGTEDCRLGPVLLSYGEGNLTKAVSKYYTFVADLSGNVLKAGGENTLTGTFSIVADLKNADSESETGGCKLHVNARTLGTSLTTGRKWYSNAVSKTYLMNSADKRTISPDLKVYGGIVDEKEYYCAGDELEFEIGLTYDGDEPLSYAMLEAVIVSSDGQSPVYSRYFDTLLPDTDFSKQTGYILPADIAGQSVIEIWYETSGSLPNGEEVYSERKFLRVHGHEDYDTDVLALEGALAEPDRVYGIKEPVPFTIGLVNKSGEELTDYVVRVSAGDGLDLVSIREFRGQSLAAGTSSGTCESGVLIPDLYYDRSEADVVATATARTKDGRIVEAKPLRWTVQVKPGEGIYLGRLRMKVTQTSPEKAVYAQGDEITFWCELALDDHIGRTAEYMTIGVSANDGLSGSTVAETGDGGAVSPSGSAFGNEPGDVCIGGWCTVTLKPRDIKDGYAHIQFEGSCSMVAGEDFSHNSNRIAFALPAA